MTIESRLLDSSNDTDVAALHEILDYYQDIQKTLKNPLRTEDRVRQTNNFIKKTFVPEYRDAVYVSGTFVNGELRDIFAGHKPHAFPGIPYNYRPTWFFSLVVSKDITLVNPSKKVFNVGSLVVRKMEQEGYYSYFSTVKFPNHYTTNEQCVNYIRNIFTKTYDLDRYEPMLEYVLWKDQDVNEVPFQFYKSMLEGTTHNKNACIVSFHLKPEYRNFINVK
jgi:hypothetical protein